MRIWVLASLLTMGLLANGEAQDGSASPRPQIRRSPSIGTLNGFVENRGQWTDDVLFVAGLDGIEATLLRDGLVLRAVRPEWLHPDERTPDFVSQGAVRIRWPTAAVVQGESCLPTAHHFFLGSRSATFVPGFERVIYHGVEPGIDIVVRRQGTSVAYDLHVAPGADLESLALSVEGIDCAALLNETVMELQTSVGPVEHRIGSCWQTDPVTGAVRPAAAKFRMLDGSATALRLGFEAPDRDPSAGMVIDPSLEYGTYVGGAAVEHVEDMLVMPDGSVYLAVHSGLGGDSPTTAGTFQPVAAGGSNVWVGKLSPDGSTLQWATFLGGADKDLPTSVDVDTDGTVVIGGKTHSIDFPVTPGCLQAAKSGNSDLFAARLSPDGSRLIWGTYYGGTDGDSEGTSALTPAGDVLLAFEPGALFGVPPPATPGAYDTVFDPAEQMLACISADGTSLVFATYLRCSQCTNIVFDQQSNILMTVQVFGNEGPLPTTLGVLKPLMAPGDSQDSGIVKLDVTGAQVLWATYFGGNELDGIGGIALDAAGAIYVVGVTQSDDFPTTPGAFDQVLTPSATGGFAAKLLPNSTGLVWSTLISSCCGGASDQAKLAVDSAGNVISLGSSNEPNYPVTPDAFQSTYIGPPPSASDAHLTKFDAFGESLVYSTYFGGNGSDSPAGMGLDDGQDLYFALDAGSSSLPATAGAYDTTASGNSIDAFVAKFSITVAPWKVLAGGAMGAVDVPNLAGRGALTPGSPARLSVRGASASAPASIIVGLSAANLPFKGGTLVPTPTLIVPLGTNAQGALDLPFAWVNVPAGINIFVQVWIKDSGAPTGFSATNALQMTSQ
jgi:hypothetical protein